MLTSILIPVYNRQNLIAECIDSALAQDEESTEIVIVDNASTDRTWEICQDYARRFPRVRVFRNDRNLGPVRNWARCMEEARGEYGKLLFSDDRIEPSFVRRCAELLEDPEVGFVFSVVKVGETLSGARRLAHRWRNRSGKYPSSEFIVSRVTGNEVPVSPGCAMFRLKDLRKNLVFEVPGPSGESVLKYGAGPDVLLFLLTAKDYPRVGFVAEPLSFFRLHPGSITIQGHGGEVKKGYRQSFVWFTECHGDRKVQLRTQGFIWLRELAENRGWVSPRKALVKYTERPEAWKILIYGLQESVRFPLRQIYRLLSRLAAS